MSSVREISAECERLRKIGEELDSIRIDVHNGLSAMRKAEDQMLSEFSKSDFDEQIVDELKRSCSQAAIYVEYVLSPFDISLRNRYANRVFIKNSYQRAKATLNALVGAGVFEKEILSNVLVAYHFISERVLMADIIIFELSEEELSTIEGYSTLFSTTEEMLSCRV